MGAKFTKIARISLKIQAKAGNGAKRFGFAKLAKPARALYRWKGPTQEDHYQKGLLGMRTASWA